MGLSLIHSRIINQLPILTLDQIPIVEDLLMVVPTFLVASMVD